MGEWTNLPVMRRAVRDGFSANQSTEIRGRGGGGELGFVPKKECWYQSLTHQHSPGMYGGPPFHQQAFLRPSGHMLLQLPPHRHCAMKGPRLPLCQTCTCENRGLILFVVLFSVPRTTQVLGTSWISDVQSVQHLILEEHLMKCPLCTPPFPALWVTHPEIRRSPGQDNSQDGAFILPFRTFFDTKTSCPRKKS